MPYPHTRGRPNFARVLSTGDPKHCCRRPARSRRNTHAHVPFPKQGSKVLLTRDNPLHGSVDTYYEVPPLRCNVAVRPANDAAIRWQYDGHSARQCARPYVAQPDPPEMTTVVKVARRPSKGPTVHAVHPKCWEAIANGSREIPGDAIAALCRMPRGDQAREVAALRCGAMVCCYFH
jgi:hypothetical protein